MTSNKELDILSAYMRYYVAHITKDYERLFHFTYYSKVLGTWCYMPQDRLLSFEEYKNLMKEEGYVSQGTEIVGFKYQGVKGEWNVWESVKTNYK